MATPIPRNEARFTVAELVYATRGELLGGEHAPPPAAFVVGVSTDSRTVAPGELFVALVGDRFDGHAHAAAALERGAQALLLSREPEGVAELARQKGAALIRSPDTLLALGELGRAHRARWARSRGRARRVVGITGSAGKTTTRGAVQQSLERLGLAVHASAGNLNNAIGVPMSLLGLGAHHEVGVIEIGMNSPGEIARGCEVARPDLGIVTLVAAAHTEGVGDVWGVQREKGALLASLHEGAVAIVNGDCVLAKATLLRSPARRAIVYGECEGADVRLLERRALGLDGSRLRVLFPDLDAGPTEHELDVRLLGRAGSYAALAALATLSAFAPELGLRSAELVEAVRGLDSAEHGRLAARRNGSGTVVIDDAYNANPASMIASIHAARELADASSSRLVLVLGAMFELGEASERLHAEVGRAAAAAAPAALVVVGEAARPLADAALRALRDAGSSAPVEQVGDAIAATEAASSFVTPGDVVLVKASNSLGLSMVSAALTRGADDAR